jgi:hypothetical protein
MEYRRRTISNTLDDIENQLPRIRTKSASVEESIDEYTEYVYNGTFSLSRFFYHGLVNLICPCFYRKREPINISN